MVIKCSARNCVKEIEIKSYTDLEEAGWGRTKVNNTWNFCPACYVKLVSKNERESR